MSSILDVDNNLFFAVLLYHNKNNVPWWRHQMQTFSALLTSCTGNSPVNSPRKGQWRVGLMFYLICAGTNSWVNNRDAGDLRHPRSHYEDIVMHKHCTAGSSMNFNRRWKHYQIDGHITWLNYLSSPKTWAPSQYKDGLSQSGISSIKIRRPWERFIFIVRITVLVGRHLHIETTHRLPCIYFHE